MKTRITAALLLLAIASMATAAPACASRVAATAAVAPECVIDQVHRGGATTSLAVAAHDDVAILRGTDTLPARPEGRRRTVAAAEGVRVGRKPLLMVLRI